MTIGELNERIINRELLDERFLSTEVMNVA
jgi:hypothetical protein